MRPNCLTPPFPFMSLMVLLVIGSFCLLLMFIYFLDIQIDFFKSKLLLVRVWPCERLVVFYLQLVSTKRNVCMCANKCTTHTHVHTH